MAVGEGPNDDLCVLQLGDSLTQGVGEYTSYREALAPQLADWWAAELLGRGAAADVGSEANAASVVEGAGGPPSSDESDSAGRVVYVGSQTHRCTPKLPLVPFNPPSSSSFTPLPHEGHCSWGSAAVRKAFEQHAFEKSNSQAEDGAEGVDDGDGKGGRRGGDGAGPSSHGQRQQKRYRCRPRVSFVMFGHNDAFQIAKLCRLKEDLKGSAQAVARADAAVLRLASADIGGSTESSTSIRETVLNAVFSSSSSLSSSSTSTVPPAPFSLDHRTAKAFACATKHLDGAGSFRENVRAVMQRLLLLQGTSASSPSSSSSDSLVLWGLNPPIGFPTIDTALRIVIAEERRSIVAAVSEDEGNVAAIQQQLLRGAGRSVALVAFEGFAPGVDTFDTTHPNNKGAALMARAWLQALRRAWTAPKSPKQQQQQKDLSDGSGDVAAASGVGSITVNLGPAADANGGDADELFGGEAGRKRRAAEAAAEQRFREQFGDGKAAAGAFSTPSDAVGPLALLLLVAVLFGAAWLVLRRVFVARARRTLPRV